MSCLRVYAPAYRDDWHIGSLHASLVLDYTRTTEPDRNARALFVVLRRLLHSTLAYTAQPQPICAAPMVCDPRPVLAAHLVPSGSGDSSPNPFAVKVYDQRDRPAEERCRRALFTLRYVPGAESMGRLPVNDGQVDATPTTSLVEVITYPFLLGSVCVEKLSLRQLQALARQLGVLHADRVVHGDMRWANVVVLDEAYDGEKRLVQIIDLDYAAEVGENRCYPATYTTSGLIDTKRHNALQDVDPSQVPLRLEHDVYSLIAMFMLYKPASEIEIAEEMRNHLDANRYPEGCKWNKNAWCALWESFRNKMPESSDQCVTRSNSNASLVVPPVTGVITLLDDLRKTIPAEQELMFTRNFDLPFADKPKSSTEGVPPRVRCPTGSPPPKVIRL
jgi:hypothetical protein